MKNSTGEGGFTLLELLVTMSLMGVLTAILIPQLASYRARAYDEHAELSLREVAVAEEAYFAEYNQYLSCDQSDCAQVLAGVSKLESGLTLQISAVANNFTGSATHVRGSGKVFNWPG